MRRVVEVREWTVWGSDLRWVTWSGIQGGQWQEFSSGSCKRQFGISFIFYAGMQDYRKNL